MALKGTLMGWNAEPTAANLDLAARLGTTWMRWGVEWPWLLNTQTSHTSGFKTSALNALDADIARVHAKGMRCIVNFFGVPTSINSAASAAEGEWHYWPTNSTGRTAMAAAAVEVSNHLDPTRDWMQLGNELANTDFNKANQSASTVGAAVAANAAAVKGAHSTLTILCGSLNAIGDSGDPRSMDVWGDAMLAANPSLLTDCTYFAVHPYIWGGDYGLGEGVFGLNDPAGTYGWNGHVQADKLREKIVARGGNKRLVITEFGEPTAPGPDFTEAWGLQHSQADYAVIDYRRAVDWYVGPEIRHNLIDTDITIDGGRKFGSWRADGTLKPTGWNVAARAATSLDVTNNPPVASFTWVATGTPRAVRFTNASTDATSYAWDFTNDGTTDSTAQNPTYTYAAAGTYTAKLTVTGPGGTANTTRSVTVTDGGGPSLTWVYDSAALPFDFPGLLDDPLRQSRPASGRMTVKASLGIPPQVTDGYFVVGTSRVGGTELLGPDTVWHDLDEVVTEASWSHGSAVERGRPEPGTMTLRANSPNRNLDPTYDASPFAPDLAERPLLRLNIDGTDKFTGRVEDIAVRYLAGRVESEFQVVDGWGQLDNDVTWTPTTVEGSGARITRLLKLGGFTGDTYVMTGAVWMQAGTEQSGSIVDQIADVAAAEDGFAFFNASGTFVFLERNFLSALSPTVTFTDALGTGGPQFSDADIGCDSRTYWPRVKVRGIEENDGWQVAGNIEQGSRKGWRTRQLTLPLAFDADKLNLARYLVAQFGQFRPRIRAAQFENAAAMQDAARGALLAAGLGTAVNVRAVIVASGTPETVESASVIAGEDGDVARGFLRVTHRYLLGNSQQFFQVNDPTYGQVNGPYLLAS